MQFTTADKSSNPILNGTSASIQSNTALLHDLIINSFGTQHSVAFPKREMPAGLNVPDGIKTALDGTKGVLRWMGSLLTSSYPCQSNMTVAAGPGRGGFWSTFRNPVNHEYMGPGGILTIIDPVAMASAALARKCLYKKRGDADEQDTHVAYPHFWIYAGPETLQSMLVPSSDHFYAPSGAFYFNGARWPYRGQLVRKEVDGRVKWLFDSGVGVDSYAAENTAFGLSGFSPCGLKPKRRDSNAYDGDEDFKGFKGLPASPSPRHVSRYKFGDDTNMSAMLSYSTTATTLMDCHETGTKATDESLELVGALYDAMWAANYTTWTGSGSDAKEHYNLDYASYLISLYQAVAKTQSEKKRTDSFYFLGNRDGWMDGICEPNWDVSSLRSCSWDRTRFRTIVKYYSIMIHRGPQEADKDPRTAKAWFANRVMLPFGYHQKGKAGTLNEYEALIHRRGQQFVKPILRHAYTFLSMVADYSAATEALEAAFVRIADSRQFEYQNNSGNLNAALPLATFQIAMALSAVAHDFDTKPLRLYVESNAEGEQNTRGYNWYVGYDDKSSWTSDACETAHFIGTGAVAGRFFVPVGATQRSGLFNLSCTQVPQGFRVVTTKDSAVPKASTECTYTTYGSSTDCPKYGAMLMPAYISSGYSSSEDRVLEVRTPTQVLTPADEPSYFTANKAVAADRVSEQTAGFAAHSGVHNHGFKSGWTASNAFFGTTTAADYVVPADGCDVTINEGFSVIKHDTLSGLALDCNEGLTFGNHGGYSVQVFAMKKLTADKKGPVGTSGSAGLPIWNASGDFKIHLFI